MYLLSDSQNNLIVEEFYEHELRIACISSNMYVMQKVSYVRKRNVYKIVRIQYFL